MKHAMLLLVGSFLACAVTTADAANCIRNQDGNVVCGKGECAIDQYGKAFCARRGGGAMRDQYGNVKCGVGFCAKDDTGDIHCSRQPDGGAAVDSYGSVKCLGGCQRGTQQRCEAARQGSD